MQGKTKPAAQVIRLIEQVGGWITRSAGQGGLGVRYGNLSKEYDRFSDGSLDPRRAGSLRHGTQTPNVVACASGSE